MDMCDKSKGFKPTRVRHTELWRCSPPSQRCVPPLLRPNSMPEDTETEEGQAHCTHVERHIAVPDKNNTAIITFEGDSRLGYFSSKTSSAHPVQKHCLMSRAACLYLPFSLPRQIKYLFFIFFLTILLILLSTIASCCGSKKLLLQAIMAIGRHTLGLVNYCSIPTRIWDLMHERWDFSFHATAARLCPMCLFGD